VIAEDQKIRDLRGLQEHAPEKRSRTQVERNPSLVLDPFEPLNFRHPGDDPEGMEGMPSDEKYAQ